MRRFTGSVSGVIVFTFLMAEALGAGHVSANAPQDLARTQAPAPDRALIDQLIAASDVDRTALIQTHPEMVTRPYLEAISASGTAQRSRAELAEAEKSFGTVLWIGRTYRLPTYEGLSLYNLGVVEGVRANYAKARGLFDQAMAVSTAAGDLETVMACWSGIGILQRRAGDLQTARESQERALDIAKEIGKPESIARALNNLGIVFENMGNGARAIEYYLESLSLKENGQSSPTDLISSYTNMGAVYSQQGDFALAMEYYRRAINVVDPNGINIAVTAAHNNIGHALAKIGQFDAARGHLATSIALAEKVGDKNRIATPTYVLGTIERELGHFEQAEALQRQALSLREQTGDLLGYVESLTELGNLLDRLARPAEGLPYLERAVSLTAQKRMPNQLWKAQVGLGHIYRVLGRNDDARKHYEDAIATIEMLRQLSAGGERGQQQYLSDRMGPYIGVAELNITAGRTFDALAVVDRARARALLDTIASGRPPAVRLTPAQIEQEHQVIQQLMAASNLLDDEARRARPNAARLAELEHGLAQARLAREAFLGELYVLRPDLQLARGGTPDLTPTRLEQLVDADTAIVSFVLDTEQAWAYVVTKGERGPQVTASLLPMSTPKVMALVDQYARQIATRDLAFSANSHALYNALLGPIDASLAQKHQVVIVPDGPLWQLPFQALETPRGKFLIEERAVSYAPSIAALSALEERRRSRPARAPYLIALGDPAAPTAPGARSGSAARPSTTAPATTRGLTTARLPEAAREVRSLGRLYGQSRSTVLVASAATESALRQRAAQASILHVATHGVLDDHNPMYSHLLLAPGEASRGSAGGGLDSHLTDGRLEAWEVVDLGISADIAVLSACQTARGGVDAWGEGIIGLSWSLFAAGTSTAIVSQWEVDSASTTALMIAFHQRLLSSSEASRRAPEALRLAAMRVMGTPAYRHPFYWAGFVSIGAR